MRFPPAAKKIAGIVTPVAALRSDASVGVGEFSDLAELGAFCAKAGLKIIQILPVNDSGFQSSPYSALSAFGLHPLYLRIGDIEEAFPFAGESASLRERFEGAERFPFEAVLRAKLDLLSRIYAANAGKIGADSAPGGVLAGWIAENDWVIEYAVYRRLKEAHSGSHWKEWGEFSSVTAAGIRSLWDDEKLRKEHLFWVWLQYHLDRQFSRAAAALSDSGIVLKGDLPILMNEDSCDVWAHPEYFRRDLSAGAPPDMYSPFGQNWEFPIYDWEALERDDYSWWRKRLKVADRYYSAYRIDHVLGFFRIWATSRNDRSAILGRFIPSVPIERRDLEELGFDDGRIRWLSRPHLPGDRVRAAAGGSGNPEAEARLVFDQALERIGNEDLWLFKESIRGEIDMERLGVSPSSVAYLQSAWRDRVLLEFEKGRYQAHWSYWDTKAYPTLSEDERRRFEDLVVRKRAASELIWEEQGERLLKALKETVPMLACAEDLGAVPDCVPRTLGKLGILGLRVLRWARSWREKGEPYVPLAEYPFLSVCTPAVHDSSTVREWWEAEADRDALRPIVGDAAGSERYTPQVARALLGSVSSAGSMICVFQLQDLLHSCDRYYAADRRSERVNVPGTINDFNWTYRLPAKTSIFAADEELIENIARILGPRAESPAEKPKKVSK